MGMLLHHHLEGEKKTPPTPKREIEKVVEKEIKTRKRNDTTRKSANRADAD